MINFQFYLQHQDETKQTCLYFAYFAKYCATLLINHCVYVHMCMCVCLYVCLSVCLVCVSVWFVCVCVCLVCVCVCVCVGGGGGGGVMHDSGGSEDVSICVKDLISVAATHILFYSKVKYICVCARLECTHQTVKQS